MRASCLALLMSLTVPVVAVAQAQAPAPAAPAVQAKPGTPSAPGAPAASTTPAAPGTTTVAAVPLETPGYTYNPEGRRDPFLSLMNRGSAGPVAQTTRENGLGGLGVGETTLKGTLASRGGFVAILQGADAKTYIVRPGEKLADGAIRSITSDAVVFLQQVNDPLSREKQREVRKVLRQTEEAK
jgi:Tfp pilus assembly protein PilP